VGMVLVELPSLQQGAAHPVQARSILLKVAPEGPIEKPLGIVARYGCVPEVEFVLAMNVSEVDTFEHSSLLRHLFKKRSARDRRVKHELMEVRPVRDRVFDLLADILRCVMLQTNNG